MSNDRVCARNEHLAKHFSFSRDKELINAIQSGNLSLLSDLLLFVSTSPGRGNNNNKKNVDVDSPPPLPSAGSSLSVGSPLMDPSSPSSFSKRERVKKDGRTIPVLPPDDSPAFKAEGSSPTSATSVIAPASRTADFGSGRNLFQAKSSVGDMIIRHDGGAGRNVSVSASLGLSNSAGESINAGTRRSSTSADQPPPLPQGSTTPPPRQRRNSAPAKHAACDTNYLFSIEMEIGSDCSAPLHIAVQNDKHKVVEFLLEHGASPNAVDAHGCIPLHYAQSSAVVDLLLKDGKKVGINALNHDNASPLHYLVRHRDVRVQSLQRAVEDLGANVNVRTRYGDTPLHAACLRGTANVIRFLLLHKSSPNVPNNRGSTPLHIAARTGRANVVDLLLRHGADPLVHGEKQTPVLEMAENEGLNEDILVLLRSPSAPHIAGGSDNISNNENDASLNASELTDDNGDGDDDDEVSTIISQSRRKKLTTIELTDFELTSLPRSFASLTHLKVLDLARNRLADALLQCSSLSSSTSEGGDEDDDDDDDGGSEVVLSSSLPNDVCPIYALRRLKHLTISHNALHTLPSSFFPSFPRLRTLNLANNRLVHISPSISSLSHLRVLNLANNRVVAIGEGTVSRLKCLEVLNLRSNILLSLPEDIGSIETLEELNVSHNKLEQLPVSLGDLQNLVELRLNKNHLTALPPPLGRLDHLERLALSDNPDLVSPPPDVVQVGISAVLAFLRGDLDDEDGSYSTLLAAAAAEGEGRAARRRSRSKSGSRSRSSSATRLRNSRVSSNSSLSNSADDEEGGKKGRKRRNTARGSSSTPPSPTSSPQSRKSKCSKPSGSLANASSGVKTKVKARLSKATTRDLLLGSSQLDLRAFLTPREPAHDMIGPGGGAGIPAGARMTSSPLAGRRPSKGDYKKSLKDSVALLTSRNKQIGERPPLIILPDQLTLAPSSEVTGKYFIEKFDPTLKESEGAGKDGAMSSANLKLQNHGQYDDYEEHFIAQSHVDLIGELDNDGGVVLVSVLSARPTHLNFYRGLIRFGEGDLPFTIDDSLVALPKKARDARARDIISALRQTSLSAQSRGMFGNNENYDISLETIDFKELDPSKSTDALLTLERKLILNSFKFGVVYMKEGQVLDDEILSNAEGSPEFDQFLDLLGERIPLEGWRDYTGGLDVKLNSTGTHSHYTNFKGREIMFHVATLLPGGEGDQNIGRKRHIGNDIVVIVFTESDQPFSPAAMTSKFNHVFVVIRLWEKGTIPATWNNKYRIEIVCKDGVADSLPHLPDPPIFTGDHHFRYYLLTKLINLERAAYHAPSFAGKIMRTRRMLLEEVAETIPTRKAPSRVGSRILKVKNVVTPRSPKL